MQEKGKSSEAFEFYAKAFGGNRSFATKFKNLVPAGWPYRADLIELWNHTKPFWSFNETTKQVEVIRGQEKQAIEAAIPFINAVMEYQRANGLKPTGVIDPQTARELKSEATTPPASKPTEAPDQPAATSKPQDKSDDAGVAGTEKPAATSPPETHQIQADVYAGAFIGLRGVAEKLKEEVATTRARGLVWSVATGP